MEHSDYDTTEFFRVMWKGLEQVLIHARAISVTDQGANRRRGNAAPAVAVNVGAPPSMAEYTDTLLQSINRLVSSILCKSLPDLFFLCAKREDHPSRICSIPGKV